MAPQDKVTSKQKDFLFTLVNAYLEAQKKGQHNKFWLKLNGAWFKEWPEQEDTSIKDLQERAAAFRAVVQKKKIYLKCWYQNHASKKSWANLYGCLIKQTLAKHTQKLKCQPQVVQLYCKLYAIEQMPIHFNSFAKLLGSLTGWKFTLLAGRPDPLNAGRIRTILKNHTGIAFSDATPNFSEWIRGPYDTFLNSVYTSAKCASRALFQGAGAAAASPMHTASTVPSETPTMSAALAVPIPAAVPPIVLAVPIPAAASSIPPLTPALGDYDYNFLWNELNLLNPIDLLNQLDLLNANTGGNMATAYREFGSFSEQLMVPLPECMYNQLLTGLIGPNMPFTPTTASSLAATVALWTTPNAAGVSAANSLRVQVVQPAVAAELINNARGSAAASANSLSVQVVQPAVITEPIDNSIVDQLALHSAQSTTPIARGLTVAATTNNPRVQAIQPTRNPCPAVATDLSDDFNVDCPMVQGAKPANEDGGDFPVYQLDNTMQTTTSTPAAAPTVESGPPAPTTTAALGTASVPAELNCSKPTRKQRSRDNTDKALIVTGKQV
ncbi:hypothetical protein BDN71DRAFT_1433871 [Pleurotus eryngii]|uniref:Uncharacterized protein n=1 Tax=Pleurotus eryngii TaxID=5323 RepID=A0A9P5ZPH2_PLEER|nr:hypothetical protein BDN71DRAFT_1433871 [Pleurotus eryngii]